VSAVERPRAKWIGLIGGVCAAVLVILCTQDDLACAAPVIGKIHDKVLGEDLTVTCDEGPPMADYRARTSSGAPMTSAYARERDANKGLVSLMDAGGRRVQRYVVARRRISAIVRVKTDADFPDWADLIFTHRGLILIRTSIANAGIFIYSDVYRLATRRGEVIEPRKIKDEDALRMLNVGLGAYQPQTGRCVPIQSQ
jgi:hypothetical protein